MKKFRRNQIVHTASVREGLEPEFWMFGRIVKCLGNDTYVVASNGRNYEVLPATHLQDAFGYDGEPYKGYWTKASSLYPDWKQEKYGVAYGEESILPDKKVFVPMPTLRKLKQNAAFYHVVWRKQKHSRWEKIREKTRG